VGLGFFAIYFAEIWSRAIIAAYNSQAGFFALPFLVVYTLMTITENVAVVYDEGLVWMLFVILGLKLACPQIRSYRGSFGASVRGAVGSV
jgi:hypothetical protein